MNLGLSNLTFPRSVSLPGVTISPGDGAPGPMGSLRGLSGVTMYENGRNTELETNNSVNKTHRLEPSTRISGAVDSLVDTHSLVFTCVNKSTILRYAEEPAKGLRSDMPQETFSLSQMNHYLKSQRGRLEYGGERDAKKFCEDWKFAGMILTKVTDDVRHRGEWVTTLTTAKRIRTKNIWAAEDRPTQRHDEAYLVAVWHVFDTSEAAPVSEAKGGGLQRWDAAPRAPQAIPNFYMQIVPVLMPPKCDIPVERLEFNLVDYSSGVAVPVRKHGDRWRVGKITDVFRKNGYDAMGYQKAIKEGVFPEYSDPEVRRRALVQLEDVEMFLAIW